MNLVISWQVIRGGRCSANNFDDQPTACSHYISYKHIKSILHKNFCRKHLFQCSATYSMTDEVIHSWQNKLDVAKTKRLESNTQMKGSQLQEICICNIYNYSFSCRTIRIILVIAASSNLNHFILSELLFITIETIQIDVVDIKHQLAYTYKFIIAITTITCSLDFWYFLMPYTSYL